MAVTHPIEGDALVERLDRSESELQEAPPFASGWRLALIRLAVLAGVVIVWQLASGNSKTEAVLIDKFWVSRPSDILARLADWVTTGKLWLHLAVTLQEMATGLIIGSIIGVVTGFVLGQSLTFARLFDPFIMAIYSIPKLALAPLFILWFGVGIEPKVVLVATVVFFLVFLNTYAGVRDVDQELLDIIRLMGAGPRDLVLKVVLPSSSAWILTGLKQAVPNSLIGAVVGEIMASNRGLGFLLINAQGQFDTAGVFAAILILMLMGLVINEGVNRAETYLLRWKAVGH
jgi:NitT/TauT family transport system permease protein